MEKTKWKKIGKRRLRGYDCPLDGWATSIDISNLSKPIVRVGDEEPAILKIVNGLGEITVGEELLRELNFAGACSIGLTGEDLIKWLQGVLLKDSGADLFLEVEEHKQPTKTAQ